MKINELTNIAILGIGTAVPEHRLDQADTAQRLAQALHNHSDSARWAKRMFKHCGVETRYTCEPNLLEQADNCRYFPAQSGHLAPSTAERMKTYRQAAVPLGRGAAQAALEDAQVKREEITHLITVSCTGQFLPGLDALLVQQLELAPDVNRIPLNFIGCAAGLKAVCMAKDIVLHQPSANVLIVCVELCTLHIQPSSDREALFGASFFGDGASACVIGCPEYQEQTGGKGHNGLFRLGRANSVLLPECADEMVWEVGNYGFDLFLSTNIPKLIGKYVPEQLNRLIAGDRPELWAIHPGGKGIIDILESIYELGEEQTRPSRSVLRRFGNMSSATILFVLQAMREQLAERGSAAADGVAVAFGPGLTCESIQIGYVPPARSACMAADASQAADPLLMHTAGRPSSCAVIPCAGDCTWCGESAVTSGGRYV